MKILLILPILITFVTTTYAGEMTIRVGSSTTFDKIDVNACSTLDSPEASQLVVSIFGKTPSSVGKECSAGVLLMPHDVAFTGAFAEDREMSFVKKINASVTTGAKYYYASQKFTVDSDGYTVCGYNTCNNDVIFRLLIHVSR